MAFFMYPVYDDVSTELMLNTILITSYILICLFFALAIKRIERAPGRSVKSGYTRISEYNGNLLFCSDMRQFINQSGDYLPWLIV